MLELRWPVSRSNGIQNTQEVENTTSYINNRAVEFSASDSAPIDNSSSSCEKYHFRTGLFVS